MANAEFSFNNLWPAIERKDNCIDGFVDWSYCLSCNPMISLYNLLNQTQAAASQAVYSEISRSLPLPIETVSVVCRIYGIQARFFNPREREYGSADSNLNRWNCRTDDVNVTGISLG